MENEYNGLEVKLSKSVIEEFTYSILEIMDPKVSDEEVIARENHWKDVFKSKEYGMNKN